MSQHKCVCGATEIHPHTRECGDSRRRDLDPHARVRELEEQLTEARAEILELSRDCVSGLLTRTTFEKHLEGMFRQQREGDHPTAIIMCDIDRFKQVNDTHGHRAGDEIINRVASAIRGKARTTDIVARYGGEEFVCLLVNATLPGVAALSERIRAAVEELRVEGCPQVTISLGFAIQEKSDKSGWEIVERADKALYRAKRLGRNRIEGEALGHDEAVMLGRIDDLLCT